MVRRNYKKEYANYHSKPAQKKNRASRNAARSTMKKSGGNVLKDMNIKQPLFIEQVKELVVGNVTMKEEEQNLLFQTLKIN